MKALGPEYRDFSLVRASVPALDEMLGRLNRVGSYGWVRALDYMGDDGAVVEAARQSYYEMTGKRDENPRHLLRYLMRHWHTTPFEMAVIKFHVRAPLYVVRQWFRHRTGCLVGSTPLEFDLPSGRNNGKSKKYTLSIEEVWRRFQPTQNVRADKQRNPYARRDRVQQMALRSVNEETGGVQHTRIVDAWESGVKPVYHVTLENGASVEMTADHQVLTSGGWMRLGDTVNLPTAQDSSWNSWNAIAVITGAGASEGLALAGTRPVGDDEEWKDVVGWEGLYEVSSYGRVRRSGASRGTKAGRVKKLTRSVSGYSVVSLSRPGEQRVAQVHRLVLSAFVGGFPLESCHANGVRTDNRLSNLRWCTSKENSEDQLVHGTEFRLRSGFSRVVAVEYTGEKTTYDIAVEGPYHNFSANGMVVHNSFNEYSFRYSEALPYIEETGTENFRIQSTANKQGSSGKLIDAPEGDDLATDAQVQESTAIGQAHRSYTGLLSLDVAREQARKVLPMAQYTEFVWRVDLHNLLNFLRLRLDEHAQEEIRDFAKAVAEVVKVWAPLAWEAFVDYRLEALTLTRLDIAVMTDLIQAMRYPSDYQEFERAGCVQMAMSTAEALGWMVTLPDGSYKNVRERTEFEVKMTRLGVWVPWLTEPPK